MAETKEKQKSKWSSLWIRILGGAICVAVLVPALLLGGYVWFAVIAFISLSAAFELYRLFGMEKKPAAWAGYASAIIYLTAVAFRAEKWYLAAVAGGFLLCMSVYVLDYRRMDAEKALVSFTGFFYTAVLPSSLVLMRDLNGGLYLVILTVIASWGCDVFAYFTGMALGKHKMSPVLSPKKSVEGAVGGVLGAALLAMVFALVFAGKLPEFKHPVPACMAVAAAASCVSMAGDLLASAFKRHRDIKDYGHLIPGHGGILDRFDSFFFVAPVIYYLALVLVS